MSDARVNGYEVPDELVETVLHTRVPGGGEVWEFLPQADAFTPHATARSVVAYAIAAALNAAARLPRSGDGASGEGREAVLEAALAYVVGAAINGLIADGKATEWSSLSGIGVGLRALGSLATSLNDEVRRLVHKGDEAPMMVASAPPPASDASPAEGREATVSLDECPPGLFWFGETLGFKSEYATIVKGKRQVDAYVVESGEYFSGGTNGDVEARGKLRVNPAVTPVLKDASPSPAPMAGETQEQYFERRLSEALANRPDYEKLWSEVSEENERLAEALTAAQKRQDEARKALEPFARYADLLAEVAADAGYTRDDEWVAVTEKSPNAGPPHYLKPPLTVADLRRARQALASLQGSGA